MGENIGRVEARDGWVRISQTDREELVRYRAFESLLAVAKQTGVQPGLEAFPASAPYKNVDVEDLLVKLIEKLGAPVRPLLVNDLGSKYPLARTTPGLPLDSGGTAPDRRHPAAVPLERCLPGRGAVGLLPAPGRERSVEHLDRHRMHVRGFTPRTALRGTVQVGDVGQAPGCAWPPCR